MHQRCPLSKCETQPHYCGVLGNSSLAREYTHVESAELTTINCIVLLPIILAVAIPVLNTRLKFKDDSILRRSMLNGQELDLEGLRIAREPRMILCGFMPKDCGATGLLTVVSIMVSVFVVTFYLMLLADWPCTTGLCVMPYPYTHRLLHHVPALRRWCVRSGDGAGRSRASAAT